MGNLSEGNVNCIYLKILTKIRYSTDIFPKVCKYPETEEEINENTKYYEMAGLSGCIGSVDATHIKWNHCPKKFKNMHKSRYGYPTRSFQVTVNHKRQCMAASCGFFGTANDKTLIKFDEFVQKIHTKRLYSENKF